MKRVWLPLLVFLAVVAIVALAPPSLAGAAGDVYCPTRDEMITIVAHKTDVERQGRVNKWQVWYLLNRESGMQHCWPNGELKISVTNDHGVGQMHPAGVWGNCLVNPYCRDWSKVKDPYVQVDVMLNYWERYHDWCPWNPAGDYLPGCGYNDVYSPYLR